VLKARDQAHIKQFEALQKQHQAQMTEILNQNGLRWISLYTENSPSNPDDWQGLLKQGESRRVEWIKEGLVIRTNVLATKWGRTRQALDQACDRGELFSLKVGKNKYYPSVFLDLDAEAVKRICMALKGDDSTAKFIFWSRKHGGLGGKTIAQAIKEGQVARAEELALGWSEEHGLVHASEA
jgi:hypothetical protein